jgi:hypothetical protein
VVEGVIAKVFHWCIKSKGLVENFTFRRSWNSQSSRESINEEKVLLVDSGRVG